MGHLPDQVWVDFNARIKMYIFKHVANRFDGEDILQEVFCKVYNNIHKLRNDSKLDIWIYQIARNAIIDYYRHQGKVIKPSRNDNGNQLLDEIGIKEVTEDIKEGVLICIKPMIEDLPHKYSEALLLTEFEGLTQKELAERLELSLSGAKSRVQRARQKLKEKLINCCHFEFDSIGNLLDYHQVKEYCCTECRNLKIKSTSNRLK